MASAVPIVPGLIIGILTSATTAQVYNASALRAGSHRRSIEASVDEGVCVVQSVFHWVVSVVGQFSLS